MNTKLLTDWINSHQPHGHTKLAALAEISVGLLHKILQKGHKPGLDVAERIAAVIGVTMTDLCRRQDDLPPAA